MATVFVIAEGQEVHRKEYTSYQLAMGYAKEIRGYYATLLARKETWEIYVETEATRKTNAVVVVQMDQAGNTVGMFNSTSAAAAQTGVDDSSIRRVIRGERKAAGGFRWMKAS